jgi:hypothetical protein
MLDATDGDRLFSPEKLADLYYHAHRLLDAGSEATIKHSLLFIG